MNTAKWMLIMITLLHIIHFEQNKKHVTDQNAHLFGILMAIFSGLIGIVTFRSFIIGATTGYLSGMLMVNNEQPVLGILLIALHIFSTVIYCKNS